MIQDATDVPGTYEHNPNFASVPGRTTIRTGDFSLFKNLMMAKQFALSSQDSFREAVATYKDKLNPMPAQAENLGFLVIITFSFLTVKHSPEKQQVLYVKVLMKS